MNIEELRESYKTDRQAVRKFAEKHGVSVQAVYWRMERAGIPRRQGGNANKGTQAREQNPNWKDGTTSRKDGYVLEYVEGRQVFQHRLVTERHLGRPLSSREVVHHKNGDPADNRIENLELLSSHAEHMRLHMTSDRAREMQRAALKARSA